MIITTSRALRRCQIALREKRDQRTVDAAETILSWLMRYLRAESASLPSELQGHYDALPKEPQP